MKKSPTLHPPRLAKAILSLLKYYQEEHFINSDFEGDFQEITAKRGRFRAVLWYWGQVLYVLWSDLKQSVFFGGTMIKNFLKINLRNIKRQKLHAFIHITGLTIGMTVAILMFLYIRFELSFDNFHMQADQIYRINAHDLGRDLKFASTQALLAQTLKADFPEVKLAARVVNSNGYFKYKDTMFSETKFLCTDPDFMDIFTFPLISGDINDRVDPFSLFITQRMAEKYFLDENPLEKTISFNNKYDFVVKGILMDIPENSYLQFDMLTPMTTLNTLWGERWLNRWVSHDFNTFVLLEKNTDFERFKQKLSEFIRPVDIGHEKERDVFFPQPIKKIHFGAGLRGEIAVLIIIIASFNYMTLETARATRRAREIGLRKVIGARKTNLIRQFLGESTVYAILAFFLAVLITKLLLSSFNNLMSRNLDLSLFSDMPLFLGICLSIGLISGVYPAFYLSSHQPTQILRGTLKKDSKSSAFMRKTLVTVQFVITIALISCLFIVQDQIKYLIKNSMQDFKDPVVNIFLNDSELRKKHEPLLQDIQQSSRVLDSTVSYSHPLRISWGMGLKWKDADEWQFVRLGPIDFNYIDFYGLKVIRGRKLQKEMATDKREAILLNETAAKASPWEDPIGKRCDIDGLDGVVIGIIEDFHFKSLYNAVEPLALRHMFKNGTTSDAASGAGVISLRISSYDIPGTLEFLKKIWKKHSTYFPFEYSFLDERIEDIYRSEIRLSRSLKTFTSIAIFLACLGLFGLTSFNFERRTKEIGIRKILGASIPGILLMFSRDIIKWVILAAAAAYPLAYYAMHEWLKRFAYQTAIGWETFILATIFSLLIALLTMSYKSIKSATADPVFSLRHE